MVLCSRRPVTFDEQTAAYANDEDSRDGDGGVDAGLKRLREWLLPRTPHYFIYGETRLHVRTWLPPSTAKIRGSIFYIHGLNGHLNRPTLDSVLREFAQAGYAVLGFDLEGNGFSDGLRAYVQDFEHVFDSVLHFMALVQSDTLTSDEEDSEMGEGDNLGLAADLLAQLRARPFFIFGESMGGMLATYVSVRLSSSTHPWAERHAGTILSAPALKVNIPSRAVVLLLQTFVVPFAGTQPMPEGVSSSSKPAPELVTRDPKVREMGDLDDWVRFPGVGLGWKEKMRWATASAFAAIYAEIEEEMSQVACALLVIHDRDDAICNFEGSQRLMELCMSEDKALVEAPAGALHDVCQNEPQWAMKQMLTWLAARS